MFSKSFKYGLLATAHLASRRGQEFVKTKDLADSLGLPNGVLAKTIHTLVAGGILESRRGPAGGCRFRQAAGDRSLRDLRLLLEKSADSGECPLGLTRCEQEGPCLIPELKGERIDAGLEKVSITMLALHYDAKTLDPIDTRQSIQDKRLANRQ